MLSLRSVFLVNAAALAGAAPLRAADIPATLPDTTVNAPRVTGSPTSPTAAQAETALERTPGAVNFISPDDYERGRASTLRDVLDYQPGVFIQSRTGQEEARLSIRGSGLQRTFHGRGILLTQDGLPLNLADGSFDMQAIDPSAYSRIAVWRGAAGLTQGSGMLGGAIDFASSTGRDAPNVAASAEGGSFGYARFSGTLSTAGLYPDTGDAVLTSTYSRTDGWRDASQSYSTRVNANVGTRLSESTENRLYFGYVDTNMAIPGALTKAQMEADPRQAAPGNITNPQRRDYDWMRLADRVVSTFDDATLEVAAGWQRKQLDHPIYQTLVDRSDDFFLLAKVGYTGDLAGQKNRLTLGVMPTVGYIDDNRYQNPAGAATRGPRLVTTDQIAANVAAYANEEHYFTKSLVGIAGVRADWSRRDYTVDFAAPGSGVSPADTRSKDYFGISPSVGARYEFDRARQQFFANLSRSFEAPTFSDFAQSRANVPAGVEAQTATTVEIGTRGARGPFSWDIAAYYAWMKDEYISSQDIPGGPVATFNANDTRHRGIEFGFDANLLGGDIDDAKSHRLVLRQVVDWNDFRFRGDGVYGDNRIAGIPETTYRAELLYRHPSGFYAGPNVECATKSWVDHANTLTADAYAVMGFRMGYREPKGFSAYVDFRNLFGTTYAATTGVVNRIAAGNAAQFNPGDGFGVYAGVSCKW